MRSFTLMHANHEVLRFSYDESSSRIASIDEIRELDHAPLFFWNDRIARIRDYDMVARMNKWIDRRAVPLSRNNLKAAFADFGDDLPRTLAMKSYLLSLSDQYWARPAESSATWEEVNFFDNDFAEDVGRALAGAPAPSSPASPHPSFNTNGFLEKTWSIDSSGTRVLLKSGSGPIGQEPFNEAAATQLYSSLLAPGEYVPYDLVEYNGKVLSSCPCMVDSSTELVSATDIFNSDPMNNASMDLGGFLRACDRLGIESARESLNKILTFDFILGNVDRHGGNFGAIRVADDLSFAGPAPIFDSGLSLLCNVTDVPTDVCDLVANPFSHRLYLQLALVDDFDWFDPHPLQLALGSLAEKLSLNANKNMDAERVEYIVNFAKSGISTVSSVAELPPCKTRREVSERGELILNRRRDAMRALGCDPVLDPLAAVPAEKRNRIPQFNRASQAAFDQAKAASKAIRSSAPSVSQPSSRDRPPRL